MVYQKLVMGVVSITSDAMQRVGFMHLRSPLFWSGLSIKGRPLTLKYREEGKMQAGAHESFISRGLIGRGNLDNAA